MNSVALYFASGESLYPGAVLLLLALVVSPYLQRHMRLRNLAASIALAMIVMACPPFAWTVDVIFLVAFGLWFLTWDLRRPKGTLQIASAFVLTALLIIFPIIEISHRHAGDRGDTW